MPDKLTDKEIAKALKECFVNRNGAFCDICPYNNGMCDEEQLAKNALDLINRLQAENERLKAKQEKCFYCTEKANKKIGEIKAEAYKECIQKIKEKSNKEQLVCSGALVRTDYTITEEILANLLKELVGEDK